MKLITKEIEKKLLANAANPKNAKPPLKLFAPWGAATWLISEIEGDMMFGIADLGFGTPEMGYVSLSELEAATGPFGLKIERDLHFTPTMTLDEYADQAQAQGGIVA